MLILGGVKWISMVMNKTRAHVEQGKNMFLFVLDAPWAILQASIEPESTAVTVNGLIPARSYQFRLCAVNDVGKGQFSKETERWAETMSWIYLYHFTSMVYISVWQ